jgi:hypothetical protein
MPSHGHRRPVVSRSTLILAILALVFAVVPVVPVMAQDDATPDPGMTMDPGMPGEPGGGEFGEPGSSPEAPFDDGATPATPEDGLLDVTDTPWDHITVAPDGRTLTVYYWSGADSCYGLAGVTVDVSAAVPTITLRTGTRPGVEVCIALAQLYSTEVVLDDPIVGGGVQ